MKYTFRPEIYIHRFVSLFIFLLNKILQAFNALSSISRNQKGKNQGCVAKSRSATVRKCAIRRPILPLLRIFVCGRAQ